MDVSTPTPAPRAGIAILALAVVALAGAGFAQSLDLEFDKAAVGDTVWTGTVSGDITGTLTTVLISADTSEPVWQVEFYWIVTADDPALSFVARLGGTLDSDTGAVAMSGQVVDGHRAGATVEEHGQLYDPERSAFSGTIVVLAD